MSKTQKILLISLSGIGNHLMHAPVFKSIKEANPDAKVTVWVAPRNTATLAKANPDIDRVIRAPIKRTIFGHIQQISKLRQKKFDVGIVLSPGQLWKSSAYLFLSGVDQRVGHRYPHLGNPDSSLFLTHGLPVKPNLHDIEQNLSLLKPLKITPTKDILPYYLSIPKFNISKASFILKTIRPAVKDPIFIGLHPGSAPNFAWKRWPIKNFAIVGKKLAKQHNAHILLFGNSSEVKAMKMLRQKIGKQNCSIIINKLLTSAAVIHKCQLFISNDSGLMHIASALDVPTIGLFGPTDENKTGPRGTNSISVRAPGTKAVYDVNTNFDLGPDPHQTILDVKPNQVLEAANSLLLTHGILKKHE